MREGWVQAALGEICRFQAGDAFGKDEQGRTSGDHPFIKVSDMNLVGNELYINRANNWVTDEDARRYRLHPTGAIVFAKIGVALSYNRRRRLTRPTVIDNNMMSAVCTLEIDPTWFYYLLSTIDFNLISSGSALPYLTVKDLSRVAVEIPPKASQKVIASVLGALDDKTELNRRMNETLEATARAIFKDWFVDFGPTRAKIEGRAPYLAADIWSLFPDALDEDGKPEGWIAGSLSDVASLNPEGWSRANYPDTVDYVDLSNTKWGTIEAITPFASDAAPSRAQRILRPGDTIVGTVRPGNGSYAFVSALGLTGSTGFAVLRPTQKIFREAVYLAATAKENIDRLAHLADGGAYPAVRPELVAATELVAAPNSLFTAFSAATSALIDRAEANKLENRTLAATRDFLLPKLMSGEVRVKDAEKLVGEAT
jgi:type I restriction enzyme S subunit